VFQLLWTDAVFFYFVVKKKAVRFFTIQLGTPTVIHFREKLGDCDILATDLPISQVLPTRLAPVYLCKKSIDVCLVVSGPEVTSKTKEV
jgi:hypothetical protein